MISQTFTQVESNQNNLLLLLSPTPSSSDISLVLNRLANILLAFETWEDPLSKRLFKWGAKVLSMEIPQEMGNEEWQLARKKFQQLFQKILVNPLDGSPLEHPVLERNWLWERSFLEDCRSLETRSPFDGKIMEEVHRHSFAEAMLNWAKTFTTNTLSEENPSNLTMQIQSLIYSEGFSHLNQFLFLQPAQDISSKMMKLFTYCQLAKTAVIKQNLRTDREEIKQTSKVLHQLLKETEIYVQEEVERARRKTLAVEENTNTRLSQIEQNHQQQVDILNSRIEDGLEKLKETKDQLNQTEQKCSLTEKQIQELRNRYVQKVRECEHLRNSVRGRSCIIL